MTPRHAGRTQSCGRPQATIRLAHAHKFFDAAELIATDVSDDEANASVAASLAVLAGIAASDAACCARLGRRSRSQDHHDAERLLAEIVPAGRDAAKDLRRWPRRGCRSHQHGVSIEPKHWKKVEVAEQLFAQDAVSTDLAPALRALNNARKKAIYEGEEPDLGDRSLEDLATEIEAAVELAEAGAP